MSETSSNSWKLSVISVFSRSAWVHEAMTYLTMYSDNFCWPVRTLSERTGEGRVRKRSPAMAAGLANHVRTMREWVRMSGIQRR